MAKLRKKAGEQVEEMQATTIGIVCSFCHKTGSEVWKFISTPNDFPLRAYICDQCIAVCNSILIEEKKEGRISPTLAASLRREVLILEGVQRIEAFVRERLSATPTPTEGANHAAAHAEVCAKKRAGGAE